MNIKQAAILFWLRKSNLKELKYSIYVRVTINGLRCEIATKLEINPKIWDAAFQRTIGKTKDAVSLNNKLTEVKAKIIFILQRMDYEGKNITPESFKNEFNGGGSKKRMLLEIIQQHNADLKKLIGKQCSRANWSRYEAMYREIKDFMKWKFNISDIALDDLKYEFIHDYNFFLKTERNIDSSTNPKYVKNLRKIIRDCLAKDWLVRDPFLKFKLVLKKSTRTFLSANEISSIEEKDFSIPRLQFAKDIFVFSCYTGLSYIDIFNLSGDNVQIGIDGNKWIVTQRQKTGVASRIPMLPQAIQILNKYSVQTNFPKSKLLPVYSNQKLNAYLKEIADCCGITSKLTFHVARHTFATTIALSNGVPLETVSKMLGHTKIETTQIYAKVLDSKVSSDMELLRQKLGERSKDNLINAV